MHFECHRNKKKITHKKRIIHKKITMINSYRNRWKIIISDDDYDSDWQTKFHSWWWNITWWLFDTIFENVKFNLIRLETLIIIYRHEQKGLSAFGIAYVMCSSNMNIYKWSIRWWIYIYMVDVKQANFNI